ncbi:MAG: hypothetical protein ACPF8W_00760 [Luminiphilus sp.]
MSDDYDALYATFAFTAWELARWQEIVDWAVGVSGAVTLIALNVLRIRRALMNKRGVDNSSGEDLH